MPRMFNFSLRHSGDKSFSEAIIDQMCQDLASESDDIISQAKNALTIRDPNNELLKMELITKLAPNVSSIRALYDLAIDIATKKAAGFLMEKIASLVEFAVSFDGIKSKTPDIQNDLSHFRRFIAVNTAVSNQLESVTDAPLNAMSFFVADHCPMLKALIRAIECAMTKEPAAVEVSAVLANSRCCSVSGSRPKDGRPMMNYLRAMTGAIILYDHTAMHGAFGSKSEVKIKRCVKELVQWKQNAHGATSELMDTIKYCSLHYNDSTTPEKIRTLMDK
uniref:CYRIA/CYRIB Rac1 binding domain-containing protein n=1 Tax=Phytophthora ramorum TaxID=164328 RepID=H3GY74_PHYRM